MTLKLSSLTEARSLIADLVLSRQTTTALLRLTAGEAIALWD
jgi:hypothetical protein